MWTDFTDTGLIRPFLYQMSQMSGGQSHSKLFMVKWEYKLMAGWLTEIELNRLGEDGWELVAVILTPVDKNFDYIFKRPKSSD